MCFACTVFISFLRSNSKAWSLAKLEKSIRNQVNCSCVILIRNGRWEGRRDRVDRAREKKKIKERGEWESSDVSRKSMEGIPFQTSWELQRGYFYLRQVFNCFVQCICKMAAAYVLCTVHVRKCCLSALCSVWVNSGGNVNTGHNVHNKPKALELESRISHVRIILHSFWELLLTDFPTMVSCPSCSLQTNQNVWFEHHL